MTLPRSEISAGDAVVFDAVSKRFAASGGNTAFTALDNVSLTVARGSINRYHRPFRRRQIDVDPAGERPRKPSSGKCSSMASMWCAGRGGLRDLRRSVGMIFQHFNLLSRGTVFAMCAAARNRRHGSGRDRAACAPASRTRRSCRQARALSGGTVGGPEAAHRHRPGACDRTQAVAFRTSDLGAGPGNDAVDPGIAQRINAELGLTVLLITHEMES